MQLRLPDVPCRFHQESRHQPKLHARLQGRIVLSDPGDASQRAPSALQVLEQRALQSELATVRATLQ